MQGVFSNAAPPPPFHSQDITVDGKSVAFTNFVVNSTVPLQSHRDFIRDAYVPFIINQIDLLGYRDNELKIFIAGSASATGTTEGNQALSDGRAQAIGAVVKEFFDLQKGRSSLARGMTVTIVPVGQGDAFGRALLKAFSKKVPGIHFTPEQIEKLEYVCRCAKLSLDYAHVVNEEDMIYLCQQVLNVKLNTKKVPANHLEEVLDAADSKLGKVGSWVVGLGFSQLKKYLINQLKETIKPMFEDFPEVAIVYETVDFIVPSDVFLCFRFKDHFGKTAQYQYTGSENKKSLDLFDAVSKLIGVLKWMTKIQDALEKVDKLSAGFDKAKALVGKLKQATGYLKKGIEDLLNKDGLIRKYCGNSFADMLVQILQAGTSGPLLIEASAWFPVIFATPGVYRVDSFEAGWARTETTEKLMKATVELDFLGAGPEGLLGYGAKTIIHADFSLQSGLLGWGFSKGRLKLVA
jgi:hypothetical protein